MRSVLTTIELPNADPRSAGDRRLFVEGANDWMAFDLQGRRTEYPAFASRAGLGPISKCTFQADGTKLCAGGSGPAQESRTEETRLPDGMRQVSYFQGGKLESRDVTRSDDNGNSAAWHYDAKGRLTSEDSTLVDGQGETTTWKIYDDKGEIVLDERTLTAKDKERFDRWSYDSAGRLVWHLALNGEGELLSSWYKAGYKSKQSSSDSLGMCRPRLCVIYKFDDQGSGRMEKTVQHTPGLGNLEPNSEEHYNFDGILDEKVEIQYTRDGHSNWTSRLVLVWDSNSNQMIEVERDTRAVEYY